MRRPRGWTLGIFVFSLVQTLFLSKLAIVWTGPKAICLLELCLVDLLFIAAKVTLRSLRASTCALSRQQPQHIWIHVFDVSWSRDFKYCWSNTIVVHLVVWVTLIKCVGWGLAPCWVHLWMVTVWASNVNASTWFFYVSTWKSCNRVARSRPSSDTNLNTLVPPFHHKWIDCRVSVKRVQIASSAVEWFVNHKPNNMLQQVGTSSLSCPFHYPLGSFTTHKHVPVKGVVSPLRYR